MLWNDSILYLHVPKTAGMAVSQRLLERLPRPVWCSVPLGHEAGPPDVKRVDGIRHETLSEARILLAREGRALDGFARILVTVRHPYAMEVSRYHYLRMGSPHDRNRDQELAERADFETFAVESTFYGRPQAELERWLLVDGRRPENLVSVRHENLEADLEEALAPLGLRSLARDLPCINESLHGDYLAYLTPRAKEAIVRKYAWVFESGLYPS